MTKPTAYPKKNAKINIDVPKYVEAFEICKLMNHPILIYSNFSEPLILNTDAFKCDLDSIPSKGKIPNDKDIGYAFRISSHAAIKYITIEKELLGIV